MILKSEHIAFRLPRWSWPITMLSTPFYESNNIHIQWAYQDFTVAAFVRAVFAFGVVKSLLAFLNLFARRKMARDCSKVSTFLIVIADPIVKDFSGLNRGVTLAG